MQQILKGGCVGGQEITCYRSLCNGFFAQLTEGVAAQMVSPPGVLSNFIMRLEQAPGTGKSWTYMVRKNGADTDVTVTISGTNTQGADTTHTVTVAAGDRIDFKITPSGSPSDYLHMSWSIKFTGDNAGESMVPSMVRTYALGALYGGLMTSSPSQQSNENYIAKIVGTPGTIKNLYVSQSAGDAPDTGYTYTLRKNGANTALTVTVLYSATSGNDTTHNISVAAGDVLSMIMTPVGAVELSSYSHVGVTFSPDTDGRSLVLGSTYSETSASVPQYFFLTGSIARADEADSYSGGQTSTISRLYIKIPTAPGADNGYVFTLRQNGVDTELTVTISDSATSGNDTTHGVSISNYDLLDLSCRPVMNDVGIEVDGVAQANIAEINDVAIANIETIDGVALRITTSPTVSDWIQWGMVCYITP